MKWIHEDQKDSKPIVGARIEPMVPGPYLIVKQHYEGTVKGLDWLKAQKMPAVERMVDEIPTDMWGQCAMACIDGKAILVAYRFDTSD